MPGASTGTATILFTDLVGSTELQARIGDAAANELRRRHDDALTQVAEDENGTVVKSLGDGLLATFGGAAEAVQAACRMQQAMETINRRGRDGELLHIRVGLSAGDVTWDDGDCHGTPVVAASRLCDAADGGQILCDDLVRGLARGRTEVRFAMIGETELKGLADPVVTYEVPWEPQRRTVAPLPGALRSNDAELPFAGRDGERERLAGRWKRAQAGSAGFALLAGEPGVGKTRLASEIARQAHVDGGFVLLGRCDEQVAAPFGPWIEALGYLMEHASDSVLAEHVEEHGGELTRILPQLSRRIETIPPPVESDPETEQLFLFGAVAHLLETTSSDHPILLVLDDAHWADNGSVTLLRHLANHLDPDAAILLLVTYRDTDIDRRHALSSALADLHRVSGSERLALRGLDESQLRSLLEAAGGHDLDDEGRAFAHRLAEETEGNPFFVGEVIRHLVETGAIVNRDGRWVGTIAPGEAGIPEGVRDVVGRRLSRLSDDANEVLRTAAVIGREFEADLVAAAAERSEDDVIALLDDALGTNLLVEVESRAGRMMFSHALVRQTLLEELSTNRRIRLHRRIAETLDGRPGTPIDLLAHHYCEAAVAGVARRAVECAVMAAESAISQLAWSDATRFLERALEAVDALEEDDPGLRAHVLASAAQVEHFRDDSERARELALMAADLARRAEDAPRLAEAGRAYQGQLGMWARPDDGVAAEIMREALDAMGDEHPEIRARTLSALAHGLILSPGTIALSAADEAVSAAEAVGDDEALRSSLLTRAWAVRGALPVEERRIAAEQSAEAALAANDRVLYNSSLYHLANALLNAGDLERADDVFADSSEFRGTMQGWGIAGYRAARAYAEGRYDEGDELCDIAHGLGSGLGESNDGVHYLQRGESALATGDFDSARAWFERSRTTAIGLSIPAHVLASAIEGDTTRAREELAAWMDLEPLLPNLTRYSAIRHLSEVAFRLGELCGLDGLVSYADRFPGELSGSDVWIGVAVDVARGRFAAVCGDIDGAVSLLAEGHALHERLKLPARIAESGLDLAIVLQTRDQQRDRDRATELLGTTIALAERLGMAPLVSDARLRLA